MTTSSAAWPLVLGALRDLLAARPGYRLPTDTAPLGATTVYVGSQIVAAVEPGDWVLLGPGRDGEAAGSWRQGDDVVSARARGIRTERGEIEVECGAMDGAPDPLVTLGRAFAALRGLELLVASDPTLGLVPGSSPLVRVGPPERGSVAWGDSERGSRCIVSAALPYMARIEGIT
jgi:hypothetical protein